MSGSDRGEGTSPLTTKGPEQWFLPLAGIVIALALAWFIGTLQGSERERRQSAPHQHAQSAKKRVLEECAGRNGPGLTECIQEQIETAEETARSEQDLTAQQQAAWGSIFGALWGGGALLVTAVGTVLLYEQIKLTRKAVEDTGQASSEMREANRIARQQMEASSKPLLIPIVQGPYIDADPLENPTRLFQPGDEVRSVRIRPNISIVVANSVPAIIIDYRVGLLKGPLDRDVLSSGVSELYSDPRNLMILLKEGESVSLNGDLPLGVLLLDAANRDRHMDSPPPVIGQVIYDDPIGIRRKLTFAFSPGRLWMRTLQRWGGEQYNFEEKISR
jgi:hypothetical protein